jgi:hypothetical protein
MKLPSNGERGPTVDCMMSLKKYWKWPGKKERKRKKEEGMFWFTIGVM